MATAKELLAAFCFIFWGLLCGEISTGIVNRSVDSRLLGEFLHQYCSLRKKSRVLLYGDLSTGWWSSQLSDRWSYLGKYLSGNEVSVTIIDLSSHGHQRLPPMATPPGGFATLMTVMYDGSSTHVAALLKRSSDLRLFRSRYNWLILTPESKQNNLEELFHNMAIYIDSNVRYGVIYASQVVKIWEVYYVGLGKPLRKTYFGYWSPINLNDSSTTTKRVISSAENQNQTTIFWKLTEKSLPYKYIKRANLEGMHLKAITVGMRQYMTDFHRNPKGVLEVTGGLFGAVFTTFKESINFTYSLKYIPGYSYGNIKELGNNWTGVVGHLASKRADIALCGISESKWRSSVIDLTAPLLFQRSRLFINSSPSPYQFDLYFRPFTGPLWAVLTTWFFLTALFQKILRIFYGMLKIKQPNGGHPVTQLRKKKKAKKMPGMSCNASPDEASASTRLVILSSSILFTVASTGYSAKLTSIHAVHHFIPEIKNIDDLSKSPEWDIGILNGSWDRWLMKNSPTNSSLGILWKEKIQKKPSNLFEHPQDSLLTVGQNQKFAYLGDSLECRLMLAGIKVGAIEDALEENQGEMFKLNADTKGEETLPKNVACKIAELPGDVLKIGSGFGLQKYSPVKDIFNFNLIKLWSTGILQYLRKRYIEPPRKLCDARSIFQPASFGDIFFSLILLGIGVLFSLFILITELTIVKMNKRKRFHKMKRKQKNQISFEE